MGKLIDLTGQKFGRLTVIKRNANDKKWNAQWICKCDCGKEIIMIANHLKRGVAKSCGCVERNTSPHRTHGMTNTRLYSIWRNMKTRCYNKKSQDCKYYGGLGITICQEWLEDFEKFYNWAYNNGYNENLSIDRIDNTKGYSPDNCRWETKIIQSQNRRNVYFITYNGKTQILKEWANEIGITPVALMYRIKKYGEEKALSAKKQE